MAFSESLWNSAPEKACGAWHFKLLIFLGQPNVYLETCVCLNFKWNCSMLVIHFDRFFDKIRLLRYNLSILDLKLCDYILQRCCRKCGEPGEDNKMCNSLNFLCRFSCITVYDLLALAIIIIWLGNFIKFIWNFGYFFYKFIYIF